MRIYKITAVFFCLLLMSTLTACKFSNESAQQYFSTEDLIGKRVGVIMGYGADVLATNLGIFEIHRYLSDTDLPVALKAGNIDAFASERSAAELTVEEIPGLAILPNSIGLEGYVAITDKKNKALRDRVDAAIGEIMASPVYEEMVNRWLTGDLESAVMPDIPPGTAESLVVAISSEYMPFEYFGEGGERLGFDVELCLRIGSILGREIEFFETDYTSLFPAVDSGYADLCISVIDDKPALHERYHVTRRYYDNEVLLVVQTGPNELVSFMDGISRSIDNHLFVENRFTYIIEGLLNTLIISTVAALFGTLLGALLCAMIRCKRSFLRMAAYLYVRIMQGTPIIVLLLIMTYVFFAGSGVDTVFVGGFAFSLYFSAKVIEVFHTGLNAIDPGQIEAAKAMGLSGWQTYRLVLIPQATLTALPVYSADLVEMIKLTSVVGYIGVMDLTYALEIIRSRTYEAIFPLLLETLIYILLTALLTWIFRAAAAKIDPKRRERRIRL